MLIDHPSQTISDVVQTPSYFQIHLSIHHKFMICCRPRRGGAQENAQFVLVESRSPHASAKAAAFPKVMGYP